MKKNSLMSILFIVLAALNIVGCKKETVDNRGYTTLFKNTFWIAEFHNIDKQTQPASIEFFENGQLIWEDISFRMMGHWTLEKNRISITLSNENSFEATITADNKLSDIQNNTTNAFTLKRGELNTVKEQKVANSQWTMSNLLLEFTSDRYAAATFGTPGATSTTTYNMIYDKKGPVVTFTSYNFKYFIVMTSDSKMIGVNQWYSYSRLFPFEITRK